MMRDMGTGLVQAVDADSARIVGETLRTAGYTEAAIGTLLGDDAFSARHRDLPVLLRQVPQNRLGTVVRAFFLVQPQLTAARGGAGTRLPGSVTRPAHWAAQL